MFNGHQNQENAQYVGIVACARTVYGMIFYNVSFAHGFLVG